MKSNLSLGALGSAFALIALVWAPQSLTGWQAGGDGIVGTWLTSEKESRIEIAKCGDEYCGSIVWMAQPRTDEKNPNPELKGRPLVGAQILSGVTYAGGDTWDGGRIYSAKQGKSFKAKKLTLSSERTLEVKVSAGIMTKTTVWTRSD